MPFKSRKQQQWYNATDQTFLDDKPHAARKVEEAEDQHDLTTPDGGDIPENSSLLTPVGEVTQEEKELKRGEQTPISQDDLVEENLVEFEGKIYAEVKGNEELSVSGPDAGSQMRIMGEDVMVLPEGKVVGGGIKLNENYLEDQFGKMYRPVYVGENITINDKVLIFENKYYTSEGLGNCAFCQGAGKITVERMGIKDCPDCDGTGDVQEQQPMMGDPNAMGQQNPMEQQIPNPMEQQSMMGGQDPNQQIPNPMDQQQIQQPDPNQQMQQPQTQQIVPQQQQLAPQPEQLPPQQQVPQQQKMQQQPQIPQQQIPNDTSQPTGTAQIPQQPSEDPEEQSQPMEKPEDKKPRFGESKIFNSDKNLIFDIPKGGKIEFKIAGETQLVIGEDNPNYDILQRRNPKYFCKHCHQYFGKNSKHWDTEDADMDENNAIESKASESKKNCACETNVKKYKSFVNNQLGILMKKAKAGEAVGMMYGMPTVSKNGRKIKGKLAYAGVSLNDRIYLPEELAKGHGKTLPLLLNHSCVAGAEGELDRLSEEMQNCLYDEKDYQVGEVKLTWDAENLTLFYEGVVDDKFFQKEIDDMDMSVSLGIFYDSDSPRICDESCYTVIKGAEFREVSLVYHAGFPIATIEAVETELKEKSLEDIHHGAVEDEQVVNDQKQSTEDHIDKLKDEEEAEGEPEHVEDVQTIIDDVEEADEEIDPLSHGGSVDVEPVEMSVESFHAPQNFSVTGITAMTISNTNGVQKYTLDPNMSYETNMVHFDVGDKGAQIFGEQLQPKVPVPNELRELIENTPTVKMPDKDLV